MYPYYSQGFKMQTRSVNMSDLHKSAVARFREQQAVEEEAARLALSGYTITARHDFITARMQRGGERILQLIEEGKHDEAQVLMNSENWGVEEALSLPVFESEGDRKGPHPSSSPLPPLL
jgi:hypothetical protein